MSESQETPIEHWPVAAPIPAATNGVGPHLGDELLAAWTADELAGDERATVERHLAACGYCQNAVEQTQRIRGLMRSSARSASPSGAATSITDTVLAQLEDGRASSPTLSPARREEINAASVARAARNRQRDGWRRASALAAALLLVASSALIFTRMSPRGQKNTPTPTMGPSGIGNIPGNWKSVVPAGSSVSDVAVVSPTDIWVVGFTTTNQGVETLLIHFNGTSWRRSSENVTHAVLNSISMVSASEGWAAGATDEGGPFMLHYVGGAWRNAIASVDVLVKRMALTHVRMATATSGWALGAGNQPSTQIFQYMKVGSSYRWVPTEVLQGVTLIALSVVSDHEAWMAGLNGLKTIVIRVTFKYLNNDPRSVITNWYTYSWDVGNGALTSVAMRSPADGWAGGADEHGRGTLFHWDGQRWSAVKILPSGQRMGPVQGIVMTGPNAGWIYGEVAGAKGSFLYSVEGSHWFSYHPPTFLRILTGQALTPTKLLAVTNNAFDDRSAPVAAIYDTQ